MRKMFHLKTKVYDILVTMNNPTIFKVALIITQTPRWDILPDILSYVRAHGSWQLYSQYTCSDEEPNIIDLKRWGCTGAIVIKSDKPSMSRLAAAAEVPVVEIQPSFVRTSKGHFLQNQSYTWVENEEIAKMAADFFLGRHFQNFAFVGNVKRMSWSVERGRAFQKTLKERGYRCTKYERPAELSVRRDWAQEIAHMRRWLLSLPKPCAVFAANDARGRQVLDACLAEGIPVPDAVAVLGVDDDPFICETSIPPLSSIALNNAIPTVLDHLQDRMTAPDVPPRRISIHPDHVTNRDSTGFVHHDKDAVIAKSLAFIAQESAVRRISVSDVVNHVGCSRRTLEMHFKHGLKRSILSEIHRRQLDRVRELLVNTSLAINEIAVMTGFLSVNRLEDRFAKTYGMTMSGYRRSKHRS